MPSFKNLQRERSSRIEKSLQNCVFREGQWWMKSSVRSSDREEAGIKARGPKPHAAGVREPRASSARGSYVCVAFIRLLK